MSLSSFNKIITGSFCLLIIGFIGFIFPTTSFAAEQLSLYIETTEGGDISKRRIEKFKNYLQLNQCPIEEITYGNKLAITSTSDFLFRPLQPSLPEVKPDPFVKLANIKIINDEKLSASILVRGSTGITNITSLDGVHMAFLSANSITGYKLPRHIFKQQGIVHGKEKITFSQTNIAAVSLLLHKDIFAAAIATPLAKKWAKANDLNIVATSKEVKAGGLWVDQNVSNEIINNCAKAFSQLGKNEVKNKKLLMLFPAWLERFSIRK